MSSNGIESIINIADPTYHIKKLTMCIYDESLNCSENCPLLKCYRVNNRYKSFKVSNNVIDLTRDSKVFNGINVERIIERSKSSVKTKSNKSKSKTSKVKALSNIVITPDEVNVDASTS